MKYKYLKTTIFAKAASLNSKEETSLSLSSSSIASSSNNKSSKNSNRRSKKYKYNLATQTATRLSTTTTVTSSHQTNLSANLRKSSQNNKKGRKSLSMYASANDDTYSTPVFTDSKQQRQRWMRNVLERLLVPEEHNNMQHYHHHSSLPSPFAVEDAPESSITPSPVEIYVSEQKQMVKTELSPLSSVVNEARLSMKRISNSYETPLISRFERPPLVETIDMELFKSRFFSEIAQKIKEISTKCLTITDDSFKSSNKTNNDNHSYFPTDSQILQVAYNYDSFDSIPFIDDDLISLSSNTRQSAKEVEKIFSIEDLIHNLDYENFETTINELILKNQYRDFKWFQIVFVFECVNFAVQIVLKSQSNKKEESVLKIKEMGANFIHSKYCDWIFEQGGWINLVCIRFFIKFFF